jgi:hypothetical protein
MDFLKVEMVKDKGEDLSKVQITRGDVVTRYQGQFSPRRAGDPSCGNRVVLFGESPVWGSPKSETPRGTCKPLNVDGVQECGTSVLLSAPWACCYLLFFCCGIPNTRSSLLGVCVHVCVCGGEG